MSIPKIIHYCWFGPKAIPELELKCMESWKKFFPDYKFMFWNEKTFDINETSFIQQAYEAKHYAFVSDYVRTKVLYEYGGLYLDTDVEILQSFETVLNKGISFLGFENRSRIGTAIMGFTAKHQLMNEFIGYYLKNDFKNSKGEINITANVEILTNLLIRKGLISNGSNQIINNIEVFSREYFYPKKISVTEFRLTTKTIAVHKFSCSWLTERQRKRGNNKIWINIMRPLLRFFRDLGLNALGAERIQKIEIKIRNILK
jgi:mannosyltransferase OCH1-like enzyme